MSASNDGSESVDQFLARIASVKEGRDRDSEERTRRMEEDFLKNRKERQARRLERARSLSPSKTGPSRPTSILSSPAPARDLALIPPVDFSPAAASLSRSNAVSLKTSPRIEPQRTEPDPTPSPTPVLSTPPQTTLSRSGTLSWQQRPSQGGGFTRPRPLSTIATVRSISKDDSPQPPSPKQMSREEIAASLASKDPTWFRQTQERGESSAAYRKNQVEDTPVIDASARSMRLPGLSREGLDAADRSQPARSDRSPHIPRALPERPSDSVVVPHRSSESPKPAIFKSTEMQKSPEIDVDPKQSGVVLPNEARSPSPTKGLGGFVQSAMMKRSDSVSKRWSVQANAGLKRGDSIAGMRPRSGRTSPQKAPVTPETHVSRGPASPSNTTHAPDSGSGLNSSVVRPLSTITKGDAGDLITDKDDTQKAPARPVTPIDGGDLARSPSKTTDQRRWSPTKSSWLESTLLAKADPPAIVPKKEEQPQWMVDLKRTKSTRETSPQRRTVPYEDTPLSEQPITSKPGGLGKPAKPLPTETERSKDKGPAPSASVKSDPIATKDLQTSVPEEGNAELPPKDISAENQADSSISHTSRTTTSVSGWNNFERKPPAVKPKPQTPPKTDFRSSLRARAPTDETKSSDEPEFKSMFGKLKSAQTKNYVAPDTFKNNILSGKAALNTTGGPQKTKRVDEFKESILQKKEAMKAMALDKKQSTAPSEPSKPDTPLPEALQRRKTLHKATPSITSLQTTVSSTESSVETRSRPAVTAKPRDVPAKQLRDLNNSKPSLAVQQLNDAASIKTKQESGVQMPVLESMTTRPKREDLTVKTEDVLRSEVPVSTRMDSQNQDNALAAPVAASLATTGGLPANSKLASRLNPNLAAFLSKGNTARPTAVTRTSSEDVAGFSQSRSVTEPPREESGNGELTYMTKGRAKGPKRRAPKATSGATREKSVRASPHGPPSPMRQSEAPNDTLNPTSLAENSSNRLKDFGKSPVNGPVSAQPDKFTIKPAASSLSKPHTLTPSKTRPAVAAKPADVRKASGSLAPKFETSDEITQPASQKFGIAEDQTASPARDGAMQTPVRPVTKPKPAVSPSPLTSSGTKMNTSKPTPAINATPVKPDSLKPVSGWGISMKSTPQRSDPVAAQQKVFSREAGAESVPQDAADAAHFTQKFFLNTSSPKEKLEFDTQTLLDRPEESEKIKTLSNAIWELSNDGKKTSMPPQQEHILFEDSTYLVVHTFEAAGSKRSEVFLWYGDRVSEAAVEDVQLFCKRDAREHNATLTIVRQGKEPASFFQALGGIVITRRNKTSALYMLCGRKHLGHIAFDEVDLVAESLCSGFPYLVSAKFGSLYLWKGKGSAIDEVGCARLIGMDLGLVGEIEEIDEGAEPSSFWDAFSEPGSASQPRKWTSEWHRRADHGGFPTKLYRVEQERPKSSGGGFWGLRPSSPSKPTGRAAVEHIEPFCQRDIEPANVYILDTYHAVYVLLNSKSATRTSEIATALHVAQEIAMLSPSIQNRRLQPSCHVVFGDPPSDVKACFRKWQDHTSVGVPPGATANNGDTAYFRLEDVMQALGL